MEIALKQKLQEALDSLNTIHSEEWYVILTKEELIYLLDNEDITKELKHRLAKSESNAKSRLDNYNNLLSEIKQMENEKFNTKNMYILKQTQKENNTVIKTENTLLGNRYVVLYFFPENKQYFDIREQHFIFNLGLNTLDVQHYQNPFILNEDGSKIIYLEDFHTHQIINDENGVLIEDLSNYVGQLLNNSNEKTSKFMETQSRIIQQAYDEKMAEKMAENNNIIVDDISTAAIPEEDILKSPTNYSLHQIFERLKSGRKRQDQLLLQDLMEIVDKKEPFVILTTQEYDNYNALVTLLIEKHLGTFKEANVNGFFKEQQLENRGYSSRATLGQI